VRIVFKQNNALTQGFLTPILVFVMFNSHVISQFDFICHIIMNNEISCVADEIKSTKNKIDIVFNLKHTFQKVFKYKTEMVKR